MSLTLFRVDNIVKKKKIALDSESWQKFVSHIYPSTAGTSIFLFYKFQSYPEILMTAKKSEWWILVLVFKFFFSYLCWA